ncbi:hypothetical protein [Paenibacillus polymyxa]|uniref:exo-rhamnogalacturonan lyase family protein n=1 Tax=Paenibacillus polymyxa TaxID=1406 RepID=UPI00234A471C|nr:hypothetical protein [Paenibacillus polymyxa]WCM63691.1 hypothetical protein OYT09_12485 [Paenibacillus polymyxa]
MSLRLSPFFTSLNQVPNCLSSGSTFRYDPHTRNMHYISEGNYRYHMVICFVGQEIWFELALLIEDEEFKDMLAQFGDYFAMTPQERNETSNGLYNENNDKAWDGIRFAIRMVVYAGYWFNKSECMQQVIGMLGAEADMSPNTPGRMDKEGNVVYTEVEETEYIRNVQEVEYANTNSISQWTLNYIQTAKIREMMDAEKG